ncbi:MAG: hypothetical protein KF773_33825 [Deltaproteobacteria bacterium]|nr:hypothetical protein [Deltaproteobacteria bacterium]MCW5808273.1 hypothetical protein [Deltaproteobacteria bacterium]
MGDAIRSLLVKLQASPGDAELRRRVAEALDAAGQRDDVGPVLEPLVNLTGHDDDAGLPCLCKKCLHAAPVVAEAGDMRFTRSFAIAGTRVLHFWMLSDLDRVAVRASVTRALVERLAAVKAKKKEKA